MKEGEILYDVVANVGMYIIYVGKQGLKVFCFGPEASNYYILNQNIAITISLKMLILIVLLKQVMNNLMF
jgi:hypothetical protein